MADSRPPDHSLNRPNPSRFVLGRQRPVLATKQTIWDVRSSVAVGWKADMKCSVRAFPQPAVPVIGFLHGQSPETSADRVRAFRQGLKDTGFVEGENVTIDIAGPKINSTGFRRWRPT